MWSGVVSLLLIAFKVAAVQAEMHTVSFDNRCGFGTPTLIQGGTVLSTSAPFTRAGPIQGATAYLQTGKCAFNGAGCTVVDITLSNKGSVVDINLIPPQSFSVATGFRFIPACDGSPGADWTSPECPQAIHKPEDIHAEVHCDIDDVNLVVTFCFFGTPTLIQGGSVFSTGITAAIAYLQTGGCGFNGELCTMVETTLRNPTSPGSGSSTDITLIPLCVVTSQ
ncbi:Glycopeptide [Mycena kentingensis (nom. inval.)]|nr:Glycopeptide [Mycena kentingensis (nom. inval.)]